MNFEIRTRVYIIHCYEQCYNNHIIGITKYFYYRAATAKVYRGIPRSYVSSEVVLAIISFSLNCIFFFSHRVPFAHCAADPCRG